MVSPDQTRWFIPSNYRWFEEFHDNLNPIIQQIERCFNDLIERNLSINEQIQIIEDLINYLKTIQIICSEIRSPLMSNKQQELKYYKIQLRKNQNSEDLIQLVWNVLLTIGKYIQTYCQAFLIPYEVEICDDEYEAIDIEQLMSTVI